MSDWIPIEPGAGEQPSRPTFLEEVEIASPTMTNIRRAVWYGDRWGTRHSIVHTSGLVGFWRRIGLSPDAVIFESAEELAEYLMWFSRTYDFEGLKGWEVVEYLAEFRASRGKK